MTGTARITGATRAELGRDARVRSGSLRIDATSTATGDVATVAAGGGAVGAGVNVAHAELVRAVEARISEGAQLETIGDV
jgi:fumarate hydratase class II